MRDSLRFYQLTAVAALLCCLFPPFTRAQLFKPFALGEPQPIYRNINTSAGLPSSESYYVLQDRQGYVWISTDRGVARYDGYRLQVFTMRDGLADDVIFKLYEDPKGRVWFVSFNGLLSYWENGKIRKYRYNDRILKFLGGMTQASKTLVVAKDGTVYYALNDSGAISISPDGVMKRIDSGRFETAALQVENGWLPSCRTNKRKNIAMLPTPVSIVYRNGQRYRIGDQVTNLNYNITYAGNEVFMHVNDDVFDITRRKKIFSQKQTIGVNLEGGELFIGQFKGGVRKYNPQLPAGHPAKMTLLLPGYSVSSVMRDREGGYWFTTLEEGVFYTPNLVLKSYTAAQGLTDLEFCSIAGNGKDVYVADLSACTKITPPYTRFSGAGGRRRPGVALTKNALYFNGLNYNSAHFYSDNIVEMPGHEYSYFTGNDYIVVTGGMTMRIYDNRKIDTLFPKKPSLRKLNGQTYFYAVAEKPDGRVFTGNLNGLFEIRNMEAYSYAHKDSLFGKRVTGIANHPLLNTIVATRSNGVYCFDDNNRITHLITQEDGILSEFINCLYVDGQGLIYVGTNRGLTILQYLSDGTFHRWIVTRNQGLPSNEVNCVYRNGDRLYIGTKKGVSTVDISEVKQFRRGGIGLAYFSPDGTQLAHRSRHSLASDVQVIRIALRTENFSGIGFHRFAYRLRHDGKWLESSDPEIVLNEPRYDDYEVSVKFRNDTGEWSKPVMIVRFSVETPFYAKWYVIALLSLAFLAIVFWVFKTVLKRVKQRHRFQTTINQLEQKALRAQMNPHFIFNSLNSIQSFLIYEENEKAERYLLKFAQLIRQTLNNSRESYITIETEMETLQRYLELEQMRFKDKFTFAITCSLTHEELMHGVPPMLIQPFVENAVLHGFKFIDMGGEITVRFDALTENSLLCVVDDNGVGRRATGKTQDGHKSFGTRITEERLAAFKQKYGDSFSVTIIDKTDGDKALGTQVVLKIPVVPPNELIESDEQL